MNDFLFLRPLALWLFIPFFALVYWFVRNRSSYTIWSQSCSKDLLPYILAKNGKRQWVPFLLTVLTGSLLITALAGPSWEKIVQPLLKTQEGLIIALDLSKGMDAQDIKPSRLQRAVYKISDLLALRREGQTALIVFSGDPFVVTPFTDDTSAIKALLPALDTTIMPSEGHHADQAIAKGAELFKQAGITNGTILLLTSALSQQEMEKSIELATKEGLTISVLAVGTEEGAPIPRLEGGFVKDERGTVVVSTLSKDNLVQLAKSANGAYAPLSLDNSDLDRLAKSFIPGRHAQHLEEKEMSESIRHDQGYLLVLLALPLASLFFRRGMLAALLFLMPYGLHAEGWDDFWKTPDQQAEHLYHQKEFQQARELFQNRDWKGAANYQLGDYEKAAELFKENLTVEGFYNYGTAKAKQGEFDAALEAYAKALEMQPDHEDALYNKKVIEELKKEQEKQNQENQNEEKSDNQKDSQEKGESSGKDQSEDQKKGQDGSEDQSENQKEPNEKGEPENKGQEHPQKEDKNQDEQKKQGAEQKEDLKDQKDIDPKDDKKTKELHDQYQAEIDRKMEENKNEEMAESEAQQEENLAENDPQRQVDDRWLQKIKDDPGGLLRRKFLLQYQQQNRRGP